MRGLLAGIALVFALLCGCTSASHNHAQNKQKNVAINRVKPSDGFGEQANGRLQAFRVMFYNVENLFDTYDDPQKNDNDFLPEGIKRWTNARYYSHLRKTAQVISTIGEWDTPALC